MDTFEVLFRARFGAVFTGSASETTLELEPLAHGAPAAHSRIARVHAVFVDRDARDEQLHFDTLLRHSFPNASLTEASITAAYNVAMDSFRSTAALCSYSVTPPVHGARVEIDGQHLYRRCVLGPCAICVSNRAL
jgi:hypothetical protein